MSDSDYGLSSGIKCLAAEMFSMSSYQTPPYHWRVATMSHY